jgi:adenylate cyclase
LADENEERWWQAELHRIKGELILNWKDNPSSASSEATAEECFRRALSTAREQSSKSLELRAAVNISRLKLRQGKSYEARQVLVEIYNWFTEGFDTADLKEAKALLEELGE